MPLNTDYSQTPDVAVAGMVADSRIGFTTVTRILAAATAPGKLVVEGDTVAVPSTVDDYILGAVRWTTTLVQDDNGLVTYKADRAAPIVTEGPIWLTAQEAVAKGDLVYAVISTNPGDVKKTAGVDTTTKSIGRAESATRGAGQLVKVVLMPAMQNA